MKMIRVILQENVQIWLAIWIRGDSGLCQVRENDSPGDDVTASAASPHLLGSSGLCCENNDQSVSEMTSTRISPAMPSL
eukprot:5885106-Karenia_brevis.AAC.1